MKKLLTKKQKQLLKLWIDLEIRGEEKDVNWRFDTSNHHLIGVILDNGFYYTDDISYAPKAIFTQLGSTNKYIQKVKTDKENLMSVRDQYLRFRKHHDMKLIHNDLFTFFK